MADYSGSTLADLQPTYPLDSDAVGYGNEAIKQIKRVMLNDNDGGLLKYINDAVSTAKAEAIIAMKNLFPVGYIYMTLGSENPSSLFGGTWEQIVGRFLVGSGQYKQTGTSSTKVNLVDTIFTTFGKTPGSSINIIDANSTMVASGTNVVLTYVGRAGAGQGQNNTGRYAVSSYVTFDISSLMTSLGEFEFNTKLNFSNMLVGHWEKSADAYVLSPTDFICTAAIYLSENQDVSIATDTLLGEVVVNANDTDFPVNVSVSDTQGYKYLKILFNTTPGSNLSAANPPSVLFPLGGIYTASNGVITFKNPYVIKTNYTSEGKTYTVGSIGGSLSSTLPSHYHGYGAATDEGGSQVKLLKAGSKKWTLATATTLKELRARGDEYGTNVGYGTYSYSEGNLITTDEMYEEATDNVNVIDNLPPYLVVNMWKKISN